MKKEDAGIKFHSFETAAAPAPMKRSVLNVRFKTERFIGAAAAAVSPLRQKNRYCALGLNSNQATLFQTS